MICNVMFWSIWKSLNGIVFSIKLMASKDVEDLSILLVWKKYYGRYVDNSCAFSTCLENHIPHMRQ